MQVERRAVLRLFAGVTAGASGFGGLLHGRASASTLALRTVSAADAPHLLTMMNACVVGAQAFHGECSAWSVDWAANFVARRPDTVVLTAAGVPTAFLEVETIRAPLPALAADAPQAEQAKRMLREHNRTTLRVTAGGVRADLLGPGEAVQMFRRVLYYGFRAAVRQGFVFGECRVPWEQHPKFARRWTDYPSCELVEAPSRAQGSGRDVYWLRWGLAEVATALAAEGAAQEQLDVA